MLYHRPDQGPGAQDLNFRALQRTQGRYLAQVQPGKGVPGRHGFWRRAQNRADAVKTAGQLAARSITDHIIVNNPGSPNLLSLGVFGFKRNTDRLQARVEKKNFKVETEARYRECTIYWLYAEQFSETDIFELLDAADTSSGISQIPTQCLPG